jgi:hypothetical protein
MKKIIPLFLLLVLFTAGCDLTGLTVTTTTEAPVVSSFEADPPTIAAGGSSTLKWEVLGATSVSIDQGIGNVALTGSRDVMPSATTVYTLTATSAAGASVPATAQVIVTGAPAAGEPDLIIEDISWSGDKISYQIKNQGDAAAGPSTSTLLVDSVVAANDSVGSLAPGESKTETFTGYVYTCTLPGDALEVRADTGTAVAESSEANNNYSESRSCLIIGPVRKK